MRCATTPSLDASVELLKEQSVHYEVSQGKIKQTQITWLLVSTLSPMQWGIHFKVWIVFFSCREMYTS